MIFKKGTEVRIGEHPLARGTIVMPVNFSQELEIVVYRVDLGGGFHVNIPDTHLRLWKSTYDGNEKGNWADIRHIWRPKC